jgi:hypothetical protein
MLKKIFKSTSVALLASMLIVASAFADSSMIILEPGDKLKSTRAISIPAGGGTLHIFVRVSAPSDDVDFYVLDSNGKTITSGTLGQLGWVSYPRTVPQGSYRLYLECHTYSCNAGGELSN